MGRTAMTGQFRDNYAGDYLLWSMFWAFVSTAAYKMYYYDNWMKSHRVYFEYNLAYNDSSSHYNSARSAGQKKFPLSLENASDIDFEEYCVNVASGEVPPPPLVDYDVKW